MISKISDLWNYIYLILTIKLKRRIIFQQIFMQFFLMILTKNNVNALLFYLLLLLSGYAFVCSGSIGVSEQELCFFLTLAEKQCKTFEWLNHHWSGTSWGRIAKLPFRSGTEVREMYRLWLRSDSAVLSLLKKSDEDAAH